MQRRRALRGQGAVGGGQPSAVAGASMLRWRAEEMSRLDGQGLVCQPKSLQFILMEMENHWRILGRDVSLSDSHVL